MRCELRWKRRPHLPLGAHRVIVDHLLQAVSKPLQAFLKKSMGKTTLR